MQISSGYSIMAVRDLPKVEARVRFPLHAQKIKFDIILKYDIV